MSFTSLCLILRSSDARSSEVKVESIQATGISFRMSSCVWSRMRERRGEITKGEPWNRRAGSWKVSDLPPPVGRIARVLLPSKRDVMISLCRGRNSECWKCFVRVAWSRSGTSFNCGINRVPVTLLWFR